MTIRKYCEDNDMGLIEVLPDVTSTSIHKDTERYLTVDDKGMYLVVTRNKNNTFNKILMSRDPNINPDDKSEYMCEETAFHTAVATFGLEPPAWC